MQIKEKFFLIHSKHQTTPMSLVQMNIWFIWNNILYIIRYILHKKPHSLNVLYRYYVWWHRVSLGPGADSFMTYIILCLSLVNAPVMLLYINIRFVILTYTNIYIYNHVNHVLISTSITYDACQCTFKHQ